MQNPTIFIDDNLLQQIINKKKFEITVYDYFIYIFICGLIISFSALLFYSLIDLDYPFLVRLCLSLLLLILVIYFLRLLFKSFVNSFYFKKIVTNIKADLCADIISEVLNQQKLSFQKSSNMASVIICMEYFAYSKSILETTIVVLDNYLLINTRNRNTSIISLHTSKISDFLNTYFRANKYLD